MRTICPYCKQDFPEVPEEYLDTRVECSVCKKQFVVKPVKFCTVCGTVSPAQALTCAKCGSFFMAAQNFAPPPSYAPPPPFAPPPPYAPREYTDSCDSIYEQVGLFTAWKKTGNFSGRSRRMEYFLFQVSVWLLTLIVSIVTDSAAALNVIQLITLVVSVSLAVRRLHDLGMSGWYYLLLIFNPFGMLLLLFFPSQPGMNEYGPNPVGVDSDGRPYRARMWLLLSFIPLALVLAIIFALSLRAS